MSADVLRWLNAEAYADEPHHEVTHRHDVNRHSADIGSFCLNLPNRSTGRPGELARCIGAGARRRPAAGQGHLAIVGRERPIVVQAVQRLFHPPFELPAWPGSDRTFPPRIHHARADARLHL